MEPTVTDQTAAEHLRRSMMALRLEVPGHIVDDVQRHINVAAAEAVAAEREACEYVVLNAHVEDAALLDAYPDDSQFHDGYRAARRTILEAIRNRREAT